MIRDKHGSEIRKGDTVRVTVYMNPGPGAPHQKPEGTYEGVVTDADVELHLDITDEDFVRRMEELCDAEGYPHDRITQWIEGAPEQNVELVRARRTDPAPYPHVTLGVGPYSYAFFIDERGELLEAEVPFGGTPDWDNATICDPLRGEDPTLQVRIRDLLNHITKEER